jgi:hypothetical protein
MWEVPVHAEMFDVDLIFLFEVIQSFDAKI